MTATYRVRDGTPPERDVDSTLPQAPRVAPTRYLRAPPPSISAPPPPHRRRSLRRPARPQRAPHNQTWSATATATRARVAEPTITAAATATSTATASRTRDRHELPPAAQRARPRQATPHLRLGEATATDAAASTPRRLRRQPHRRRPPARPPRRPPRHPLRRAPPYRPSPHPRRRRPRPPWFHRAPRLRRDQLDHGHRHRTRSANSVSTATLTTTAAFSPRCPVTAPPTVRRRRATQSFTPTPTIAHPGMGVSISADLHMRSGTVSVPINIATGSGVRALRARRLRPAWSPSGTAIVSLAVRAPRRGLQRPRRLPSALRQPMMGAVGQRHARRHRRLPRGDGLNILRARRGAIGASRATDRSRWDVGRRSHQLPSNSAPVGKP
jgi:hypothetical protein